MRAVIQRVSQANVEIEQGMHSSIKTGLLVFVSVEEADMQDDIEWLSQKIINMRLFDDKKGIMNLSLLDIQGEVLIVSNFTLYASTKKGNRPTYIKAAPRTISEPVFNKFVAQVKTSGLVVQTGVFGADMHINMTNNGPVTIIIDSKERT